MRRLAFLAVAIVAAWLAASAFLFVWPREDAPARADAVVVLSGGRKARLAKALELIDRDVSQVLVISDGRDPAWPEANRLCAGAAESFRVICFRADPYSTRGEAEAVAKLGRAHGWRSLLLVTSTFHVFRARMVFRRCFPGTVWAQGAKYDPLYLPRALFWETGKLAYALTFARGC